MIAIDFYKTLSNFELTIHAEATKYLSATQQNVVPVHIKDRFLAQINGATVRRMVRPKVTHEGGAGSGTR